MDRYVAGVDIGGTTIKFGLFTTDGALLKKWERPTRTEDKGMHILPDIAEEVLRTLREKHILPETVAGVGLGVPGAVLNDRFVRRCVNLNGWGEFDVAAALSDACRLTVRVVNDANAAALGEMWKGSGSDQMVFVTLGTGVGGGVIVNGRLLPGVHGAGGEIGHIKLFAEDSDACGCGKAGCLEQYASATGVVRLARKRLAKAAPAAAWLNNELTAKAVFDAAIAGDTTAQGIVSAFSEHLGRGLASISCVCDPEVFVLGGGVAKAGAFLLDAVQAAFRKYAFPAAEDTAFRLAELGNDAGIYGAARRMLEE